MTKYYLTCRSLTAAQRSAKALSRAGIGNALTRTPEGMSREGCGYSVTVREGALRKALETLEKADLAPRRVFALTDSGEIREAKP